MVDVQLKYSVLYCTVFFDEKVLSLRENGDVPTNFSRLKSVILSKNLNFGTFIRYTLDKSTRELETDECGTPRKSEVCPLTYCYNYFVYLMPRKN